MTDRSRLDRLRRRIRAIEGGAREAGAVLPLGVAAVDAVLPGGGLPLAHLHQVTGTPEDPAEAATGPTPALAFTALLAARLAARKEAAVLWCVTRGGPDDTLYPPGLAQLGLPPDRLLIARAADTAEVLWCMEEGLRCPALAAVVGQARDADLTAGRRLQLAAESGGVTGLLLATGTRGGGRGGGATATTSVAATTRWRIGPAPAAAVPWPGLGAPRWDVTLERCRGALPARWTLEWSDDSQTLRLATAPWEEPLRRRA